MSRYHVTVGRVGRSGVKAHQEERTLKSFVDFSKARDYALTVYDGLDHTEAVEITTGGLTIWGPFPGEGRSHRP